MARSWNVHGSKVANMVVTIGDNQDVRRGLGASHTTRMNYRVKRSSTAWLFLSPFLILFIVLLIFPLLYALYLSLFTHTLAAGTHFSGISNYIEALHDPSFLGGLVFVGIFCVVIIPLQIGLALLFALIIDAFHGTLAKLGRIAIFLPYAVPSVIGALMWGFLYSPLFGPLKQLFGIFGLHAPSLLSPSNVLIGLVNILVWQWSGYFMVMIYAALRGVDPELYDAAAVDGANQWQIALRVKIPEIRSLLVLITLFSLIGNIQLFSEPQILIPLSNGSITQTLTPNMYAYNEAFSVGNLNYASALSFLLGLGIFVIVGLFLLATRERKSEV